MYFYKQGYRISCLAYFELNQLDESLEMIRKILSINPSLKKDIHQIECNVKKKLMDRDFMRKKFKTFGSFELFQKWMYDNRVYRPKLEIKFDDDVNRGVVARSNIKKDEIIMMVPSNLLITLEISRECNFAKQIGDNYYQLNSPKHCLLSLFVLTEKKKPDSFWRHYLDILPSSYDSFPIFYSDEEKQWLEGCSFLEQLNEKIKDIEEDYYNIKAVLY